MPDEQSTPVVLINTFRLEAENQAELIALLVKATEESVVTAPGFGGATLHRSLDGARVVMYARWQSSAHYEEMRASNGSMSALEELAQIATFERGTFAVVCEFQPSDRLASRRDP